MEGRRTSGPCQPPVVGGGSLRLPPSASRGPSREYPQWGAITCPARPLTVQLHIAVLIRSHRLGKGAGAGTGRRHRVGGAARGGGGAAAATHARDGAVHAQPTRQAARAGVQAAQVNQTTFIRAAQDGRAKARVLESDEHWVLVQRESENDAWLTESCLAHTQDGGAQLQHRRRRGGANRAGGGGHREARAGLLQVDVLKPLDTKH